MARRGGELEAFTAFCGGSVAAFLGWLGLLGLTKAGVLPGPVHRQVALTVGLVVGLGCTVGLYRALRASEATRLGQELARLKVLKNRQDSKSRAANNS
ncbi:hypothetical protein [Kitasatospora sp. MAP5-34]|uniref:hypothetical protein n=1 Tax=Kitasatospora sp. MAP5-34 TaxID=3035102 RepID=UPI002476AB57|nr:hypothetical protein [Kitasatospora sp. MAP5-34]MDH6577593.1 hypothetical protein [Kitasatospora sp. MAP5-34]